MIWIYRLLFPVLFLAGLPFYLFRMLRRGGYGNMLAGRFGWYRIPKHSPEKRRVWLQAVSVGEMLAIEGLLERLCSVPNLEVILSTTTSTGFKLAGEKYGSQVLAVIPFPLDFWPVVRGAWRRIQPDVCVITEAELWPEHLHEARRRGVPLILINARLSDKSFRRMKRAMALQPLFYHAVSHIAAASELDAERILELGYPAEQLSITGNLKFDVADGVSLSMEQRSKLLDTLWQDENPVPTPFTLIGASTWPGEERLLLDAVCTLSQQHGLAVRLILTPRHAERRAELRSLLQSYGDAFSWQFRSRPEWKSESAKQGCPVVHVADTTGELKFLLQVADVAVIGRSFPPHTEGQTPIEAAALGIPVVYGPSLSNFRAICRALEAEGGACRILETASLSTTLAELLQDMDRRQALSQSARRVFERSRGSTERTFQRVMSYF